MAVAFRNGSSASAVGGSYSVTKPTGLTSGDVQYAFIHCDNTSGGSIAGGATWTQIGSEQAMASGDGARFTLWRQVAGGSEPASYTITNNGGNGSSVALVAYSGVDTTTPEAAQLATNGNSGSPPSSPVSIPVNAVTTTADNQFVVWFGLVDWNSGSAATFTDPASTTRRAVETPAQFSNALAVDFTKATAGSTGTITGTGTLAAATGNYGGWVVALLSAAPVTPTIDTQPTNQTVALNGTATFTVAATTSGGTLHYQWKKNGANVGTDSATYQPTGVYSDQGAGISVVVTDSNGSTTSNTVYLTVTGEYTSFQPNAFQATGFTVSYGVAGSGGGTPVGQANETDSAQTLASARPAGVGTEADTALAAAAVQIRAVGLGTEADTGLSLTPVQLRAAGLSTEADSALALSPGQNAPAGLAAETDSAITLSGTQLRAVGVSTETDAGTALSATQIKAAGNALEADSASALGSARPATQSVETDAASALSSARPAGLATETDASLALSPSAGSSAGLSAEADSALVLAGVQTRSAGNALETDAAQALTRLQLAAAQTGSETDAAQALSGLHLRATGLSTETDAAQALASAQARAVGIAAEADSSLLLIPAAGVGSSVESDTALALTGAQIVALGRANESDTALALAPTQIIVTGLAEEIDEARTLTTPSIGYVGRADEHDTAFRQFTGGGTGASPEAVWGYTLTNGLTAEQTLVELHAWIRELYQIHGLELGSPLTVTAASRSAAAIVQAVGELAGTVTVTRQ